MGFFKSATNSWYLGGVDGAAIVMGQRNPVVKDAWDLLKSHISRDDLANICEQAFHIVKKQNPAYERGQLYNAAVLYLIKAMPRILAAVM